MAGMFDALLPGPAPEVPSLRFATVTAVAPLRIRLDGDADPLPMAPTTVASPALGARVLVLIHARQAHVLGALNAQGNQPQQVGGDLIVRRLYQNDARQNPIGGWVSLITTTAGDPAIWFSNVFGASPSDRPRIIGNSAALYLFAGTAGPNIAGPVVSIQNPIQYAGRPEATFAANVGIASSPVDMLYKITSKAAAKILTDVVEADPELVLDVPVRSWIDRGEAEGYAAYLDGQAEVEQVNLEPFRRIPGVVAEEVEAAGLGQFVTYEADPDNPGDYRANGVMYDRLPLLLIPVVRAQRDRISALEATVEAQEQRLQALEQRMVELEGTA